MQRQPLRRYPDHCHQPGQRPDLAVLVGLTQSTPRRPGERSWTAHYRLRRRDGLLTTAGRGSWRTRPAWSRPRPAVCAGTSPSWQSTRGRVASTWWPGSQIRST
jgi:hypothetical protein